MRQITLPIVPRLPYEADGFLVHQGICSIQSVIRTDCSTAQFHSIFLQGERRSGKTHLSIYLSGLVTELGLFPRLLTGLELFDWLSHEFVGTPIGSETVFIVDEAEVFLERISQGDAGPYVRLYETCRLAGAKLVFISLKNIEEFELDGHSLSRLAASSKTSIGTPEESELAQLLVVMARQRGIELSPKSVNYILKRTGKSVAALEHCLERASYLAQALGRPIDLRLFADALGTRKDR